MMVDLKPCPFCGCAPVVDGDKIVCPERHCWGPIVEHYDSIDDAAEAWNRRAASPSIGGVVKPLEWRNGCASTSIGDYLVVEEDWDEEPFWFIIFNGKPLNKLGEHKDEASAIAACQADYESRILSALLPSPSPAEAAAPEHLSPRPWRYVNTNGNPVKGMADWIEDAAGNIVVENVGHIDGPFIVTRVNGGAVSPVEARAAGDDERECWRANLQAHVAAERMVREAIETLFGPLASLESEDAVLLRGPEPHHSAEAIIAALQRLAALTKQTEA